MPDVFNIEGVEIFSVGKWNGDAITKDDLECMVQCFNETKEGARPFLKLGHADKQKLLQEEGLPAAGWIEKLYIQGEKLLADWTDVPKKVFDLIQTKAYRKVSSEVFWNVTIGEKKYRRMLGAVALLGAETPGVMNLKDILANYYTAKVYGFETEEVKEGQEIDFAIDAKNTTKKGGNVPDNQETAEVLKFKLDAKETEAKIAADKLAESEKAKAALETENEELKKFKSTADAEKKALQEKADLAEQETFLQSLVSEKLITPSMKPYVAALLGEQKKTYSITVGKEEKKHTKQELISEALKLFKAASAVNFEESSVEGEKDNKKTTEAEMDKKAKEYAKEKNVSYSVALKQVMSEAKQK